MTKNNKKFGFTLIELLIYTAVFIVAAGLLTTVLVITTRIENTEIVSTQVGQELNLVLSTVQRLVRDASLVECVGANQGSCNPATASGSFLRLRYTDPTGTKDPTCIYLENNVVKVAEGHTNDANLSDDYLCDLTLAKDLTTSKVNNPSLPENSLVFTKFDVLGGHATVQIDASLTYNSANPDLQISKTLRSAVGRASAATFDSDLIPNVDNSISIGSITGVTRKWKNLFVSNLLGLGAAAIDPVSTTAGTLYFNTTANNVKVYNGTSWKDVGYWMGSGSDIYYNTGKATIGGSTPSAKLLTVTNVAAPTVGPLGEGLAVVVTGGGGVYVKNNTDGGEGKFEAYGGNIGIGSVNSTPLQFWTSNSAQATLSITGNWGLGMVPNTSKLAANGVIESTSGGFKFPDGTTQATAASSGGFASGARAYQSTGQTLSQSVETTINFQTESYDGLNEFSSNRFTAQATGRYIVNASVGIQNPAALDRFDLAIVKSGNYSSIALLKASGASDTPTIAASDVLNMTAGQWVEVHVWSITNTRNTQAQEGYTRFTVQRVY